MLFSSVGFPYFFLPVTLAAYYLAPRAYKNGALFAASLVFYLSAGIGPLLLLLCIGLLTYLAGRVIGAHLGQGAAKAVLCALVVLDLIALGVFKYADFFIQGLNAVSGLGAPFLRLALPLGISFYTFHSISYAVDIYRGDAPARKNIWEFSAYLLMFARLPAGPIAQYRSIQAELSLREHSFGDFAAGVRRFVIGLAKKALLADTLATLAENLSGPGERSVLACWVTALAFALQIYFDFSGYSDMAIGLGRIFGFHFPENFRYPFLAGSIAEFWRRWHISLGAWFRDYLYIPLGGSRTAAPRHALNLLIVWTITGLWHGASLNYLLWGLYFGLLLVGEKFIWAHALQKRPALALCATQLSVLLGFVIFSSATPSAAIAQFSGMFGLSGLPFVDRTTLYYFKSNLPLLLVAAVGATPLCARAANALLCGKRGRPLGWVEPAWLLLLMVVSTGYLVDGSFRPFLYFGF
ncbi:MAG: MBOAT family O-acyltransferase [Bacillota bacterium]